MIEFQWDALLLLLVLVPLLIALYAWAIRRRRPGGRALLEPQPHPRRAPGQGAAGVVTCRSRCSRRPIAALVLAMARPTAVVAVPTTDRTIVLALDVSRSMCASDI